MNKGKNDHWYASTSNTYFITTCMKDDWGSRKFESSILVMCFHFWYPLSSGPYLFGRHLLYFHLEYPFRCSFPHTSEYLLDSNCLLCLDFIGNRAEEVCIRILHWLLSVPQLVSVVSSKSHEHFPPPSLKPCSPGNFLQRCPCVHTGLQMGPRG